MTQEPVGEVSPISRTHFRTLHAPISISNFSRACPMKRRLLLAGIALVIADTIDDGDIERLADLTWKANSSYAGPTSWVYEDGPFVKPTKPVSQMRSPSSRPAATSWTGRIPKPFGVEDMTQEEASDRIGDFLKEEPSFSAIPFDTPAEQVACPTRRLRYSQRVGGPERRIAARALRRTGGRWPDRRPAGQCLFVRWRVCSDASTAKTGPKWVA